MLWPGKITLLPLSLPKQQVQIPLFSSFSFYIIFNIFSFTNTGPSFLYLFAQDFINRDERIYLDVRRGSLIELTFEDFQLESDTGCDYDYVKVLNSDEKQLWKGCGKEMPPVLKSSGNKMTIVFHSDGSGRYRGFRATWRQIENKS